MIDLSRMRHRVWLQQQTTTGRTIEGGLITAWSSIAYLWSSIEGLSGREIEVGKAIQSERTHKIIIRWSKVYGYLDLSQMRFISHFGDIFNIEDYDDKDRKHEEIVCYVKLVSGMNPQTTLVDDNHQALRTEDGSEPLLIGV